MGVTIGYDAETGARDWIEQTSSASGPTFLWRLAVAGDRVVVTGQTGDYQGHRMLTIGYEASTGTRAWRVIGPEGLANGVGIQSDGTVAFVIGNEEPATAWNVFAVRT